MVTRSVVQSAIHTAAVALAHLPEEEWPGWIAYLLQALEEVGGDEVDDLDSVLEETLALLQARKEQGGW
jgi:hypothetical protein